MAWRLSEAVAYGEIDNTQAGVTTGKIWLHGRDEPLILELQGDCLRDLAGTRLQFENKHPLESPVVHDLDTEQLGWVGDMTASRRCKVATCSDKEIIRLMADDQDVPYQLQNAVYLEWYSEANGRVLIESAGYNLTISPAEWQMDEDEEQAQLMANMNSMRDFVLKVTARDPQDESPDGSIADESIWEKRLELNDRIVSMYKEVREKFIDDVDFEQKQAFVMGWDGLLENLASRNEFTDDGEMGSELFDLFYNDYMDRNGDHEDFDDEEDDAPAEFHHPLYDLAEELAMRAVDILGETQVEGSIGQLLTDQLLEVTNGLALALNSTEDQHTLETGYVLAMIKRSISGLERAMQLSDELSMHEHDGDQLAALRHITMSAKEIYLGLQHLHADLRK